MKPASLLARRLFRPSSGVGELAARSGAGARPMAPSHELDLYLIWSAIALLLLGL